MKVKRYLYKYYNFKLFLVVVSHNYYIFLNKATAQLKENKVQRSIYYNINIIKLSS